MRRLVFVCLWLCLSLTVTTHAAPPPHGEVMTAVLPDGEEATYILYSPATLAPDTPAPLLVVLHGRMMTMRAMEAISHLNPNAEAHSFRVAYLQSHGYTWQDGWKEAGVPRYEDAPGDDFALVSAIEADLRQRVAVDALYYVGFDTGGHMAARMMCERGGELAGVALVASLPWNYWPRYCPERLEAGRVLIMHGDLDTTHRPEGNDVPSITLEEGQTLHQLSREELLAFFIERSGCTDNPTVGHLRRLTECAAGGDVSLVTVPAGGHEWFRAGDYAFNQKEADAGALIGEWVTDTLTDLTWSTLPPEHFVPRTHHLFLPSDYDGTEALPLVIGLHGRSDTGAGFALLTGMDAVAEAEGFALVYPDGLLNQWNYLGDFVNRDLFHTPDDVAYLERLIDDLAQDVQIDRQRVYLMGFSNGGFMTYRVGCEVRHPFAGFSVLGALMYPEFEVTCPYARPTPIIIFHGTQDQSILWDGVTHPSPDGTSDVFATRSVLNSVGFWTARNQCDIEAAVKTEYEPQPEQTQVIRFDFTGCVKEANVRFFAIVGGGHTWPGGTQMPVERFGRTAPDINAGQEIWDFLSQFRRDDL